MSNFEFYNYFCLSVQLKHQSTVYDTHCLGFKILTEGLMKIQISWDVTDILEKSSATTFGVKQPEKTWKMEALCPFNIQFSAYHSLQQNTWEDLNPQQYHCEDLKSHINPSSKTSWHVWDSSSYFVNIKCYINCSTECDSKEAVWECYCM